MTASLFSLAFMTGLFGSGHCLGMCGSLVAACALTAGRGTAGLFYQSTYHAGRVCTYTAIGALVGWLGSAIAFTDAVGGATLLVLLASDLFIVLVGLANSRLLPLPAFLDHATPRVAHLLATAVRCCSTWPMLLRAFPLGLLLGLIPCGYVYALAITAAQSGSALQGALTMFGFGLGTVPALLAFGSTTQWLGSHVRLNLMRLAGLTVAIMGVISLIRHLRQLTLL